VPASVGGEPEAGIGGEHRFSGEQGHTDFTLPPVV
jgi:hypothetical protein